MFVAIFSPHGGLYDRMLRVRLRLLCGFVFEIDVGLATSPKALFIEVF